MDRTAEDYQKDLLWQTALETFYRVAYTETLMTSVLQKWKPIDGIVKTFDCRHYRFGHGRLDGMGNTSRKSNMGGHRRKCCIFGTYARHP